MSVAPSRSGSRMQQFDDVDVREQGAAVADQEGVDHPADGVTNGVGGRREVDDDEEDEENDEDEADDGGKTSSSAAATTLAVATSNSRDGGGNGRRRDASDEEEEDDDRREAINTNGGYWRSTTASRPGTPPMADNASDVSSMMPPQPQASRPKSRNDMATVTTSRYSNLSYWKARRVVFYKNGDPFFPGIEFRFKPGRDIVSLESLLDKLSLRMDLPRGARYIFSMDGDRKYRLDELEDGASYVVSSYKAFKAASYGKKNGIWYAAPGGQGWSKATSRKASIAEADAPPSGGATVKPSSGRVIRIINNMDHTIQCRVLLNLRTSQPFEEVLEDLGQVLKMNGAKRMYTVAGQEVRSFSQLRNEFADVDTFYLGVGGGSGGGGGGSVTPAVMLSPVRRARSRMPQTAIVEDISKQRRARSKSRPRALYAPESEIVRTNDYTLLEVLKEEPIRVTIKGLRRTFYPPIHHAPVDNTPPDKKMQLEWVYGYRGTDSRRNLWVLPTGELLYFVAAVAVMYDRDEETQRHYTGHTEDIQCMDLHPSREMVASGQRAGRNRKTQAHIRIWSTETLQTLYVFGMGELELGVAAVAFSQLNGGSYVLAVDAGRECILSVWQWQWGHLLGKVATLQEELTGAAFHPLDDNLMITHGKGHLTFWNRRKDGFFERTDIIKPPSRTLITSLQFEQDGDVITADSDGFITIYSVDADGAYFVRMEYEAHNKGVSSLIMLSEGTLLSGGEKDRRIAAWDSLQNYKKITDTKLPEVFGGVRSIYPQRPGRNDGNIYVGTTKNNILEGSLQRRFNQARETHTYQEKLRGGVDRDISTYAVGIKEIERPHFQQVVFGHGRQLWGLAVHPDDEVFATAGHDKNIALWRKNKLIWVTQVSFECIALSFHPFGVALAVGSTEGHLIIMNSETGVVVNTIRVCGSPLNCVGFNPSGELIAIASQNGSIYLFRVSRDGFSYKKSNKIRGSQPLMQMDWSSDSNFLQTVTADYDLAFWDVKSLSPEKSPIAMKDVKWYTHNSTVGFMVAGIWNNRFYPMTSILSTVSRSAAHDLLISGDTDGYLRLFRYPCLNPKAEYNEEKVYSGTVACARFLFNDRNLVTVGGTDASLMLWQLVEE